MVQYRKIYIATQNLLINNENIAKFGVIIPPMSGSPALLIYLCYTPYMLQVEQLLKKFGLSEREAQVYLALYSQGPSTGYQLAQKTGLTKSTVYFVLEELRSKGLVLKSPGVKKQLFTAKDPGEFLHERKHDIRTFEELMPKLRALEHNTNRPNIL